MGKASKMELSLFLYGEGFCEDYVRKRCKSYVRQNEKRALKHPRYVGDSEPPFAVKSACSEMFGCAEREIMTCGHCEILQPVPQC
jgi:hypothetical protein